MSIPETMTAVVLTGHGGLDKLEVRDDVPVPKPGAEEVLIRVGASGMNNTDINTRTGWYNPSVTSGTTAEGGAEGFGVAQGGTGTWTGVLTFPRIQGADVAGRIAALGSGVDESRMGERVVVDPWLRDSADPDNIDLAQFFGSERNGGFAQFVTVPASNAHPIESDLSDAEIATLPCSGATASNMLLRAGLARDELLLVPGASGGVGSFLVQIGRYLGARVVGIAGEAKMNAVKALGVEAVVPRDIDDLESAVLEATGGAPIDVVADVVGGDRFPDYLALLRKGGRYVTSGAIAGPMVALDLRTLYLKDLAFYGATVTRPDAFSTLLDSVESGVVRPQLAKEFPLEQIREAQTEFLAKRHVGSFVLVPPAP